MEEESIPLEIESGIVSRIVKKFVECVIDVKKIEGNCGFSLDAREKARIFMLQIMKATIYLTIFTGLFPYIKEVSSCIRNANTNISKAFILYYLISSCRVRTE